MPEQRRSETDLASCAKARSISVCITLLAAGTLLSVLVGGCLLPAGGWPNRCEQLISVARQGNVEEAKTRLLQGVDPNCPDKHKRTALFHAVSEGRLELARLLIEKGADVNVRDEKGVSALAVAARKDNPDIVKLLLDRGAKPKSPKKGGSYCSMR